MTAGLRALMRGVIDYAGLFPPAKLPLEEAVEEFLAIRESPEAWMLGRFVIPASDVHHLEAWAEEINSSEQSLRLALIGRPSDNLDDCHCFLSEDLYCLCDFINGVLQQRCDVSLELPLPKSIADGTITDVAFEEFYECIQDPLNETATLFDNVFVEVQEMNGAAAVRSSLITIAASNPDIGFKLRTGGLKPEAFPEVDRLASVIRDCHQHECPWKATAGLHHPIRHTDAQLGAKMHGFLNVLFASVLAEAHDLPVPSLCEILSDEDAANFQVSDDGIRWRDFSAAVAQIEFTRQTTFQSFGSCSFDEPRNDLTTLGLL